MGANAAESKGIRASVRRVVAHGGSLVRLQRELAQLELGKKATSIGIGVGLLVGAALLLIFVVGFGLAAAAAALALVLDWWLALLVVFGGLLLLVLILVAVGASLVRRGTPLAPTQAVEEARLTKQVLRTRG